MSTFVFVVGSLVLPGDETYVFTADVVVTAKEPHRAASAGVVTAEEIGRRPFQRAGEVLETIPGVVVTQHSGEGKANQYYLRGFNLDHGTDIAITVAGAPVNMPTHAHGQGYADANFLIPELIGGVQYKKGPYYADEGDFASAGAVNVDYVNQLEQPLALLQGGTAGFGRALFAASPRLGDGVLLYAFEAGTNDGPWVRPDDFRKTNAVLRYTRGGFGITAMDYRAKWSSTDQIPGRAVSAGSLSRFGLIDPSDGGNTSRTSLAAEWQRGSASSLTQASVYGIRYRLDLFSNFTYFLDDPVNGDQFEQEDDRLVAGARASHRWLSMWGAVSAENTVGAQFRRDDIRTVGLYHTRQRSRLETIRRDALSVSSGGVYAESALQWSRWLRTIAGARIDRDRTTMVSPKLTMIFGPWRGAELFANAGTGFHSNDARTATARPLVRTRGAEIGVRTAHVAAALWALEMDSELLFAGDAGTTEPSAASRRAGIELSASTNLSDWLAFEAGYAYSRARFRGGDRIPGAIEGVASAALSVAGLKRFSGELRYRYFGPRPLTEDGSVRSQASSLVNARIGYRLTPRVRLDADVFNLLDAKVSDIDYFYASRLPGEPAQGIDDVHFHPVEKRALRLGVTTSF